jgi:hypothetical protein
MNSAYPKTVDELLESLNLSDEEREQHRALIEESRMRETQIAETTATAKENIEKLGEGICQVASSRANPCLTPYRPINLTKWQTPSRSEKPPSAVREHPPVPIAKLHQ